ncbi:MAG: outer membrane beta-barrel protein [Oleiphilaceae bacterium]|nr:outer membrane beta-barrel protein [Oleiphilaceae bacterium]
MTIRTPLLALAVAAFMAPQAMADDPYEHPYVGISGGQSELDEACDGVSGDCDDTNTFYRIYSGARLLPNFGTEVGYTHNRRFGSLTTQRVRPKALDVVGNAFLPLGENVDLYAKAGAFLWRARVETPSGNSRSEDGVDFKTGVGLRLGFGHSISVRFDFDYIPDFGSSELGVETDLTYISGGLQFGF